MTMLWELVSSIRVGVAGQTFVVNTSGEVVAHPNTALTLGRASIGDRPEMAALMSAGDRSWSGTYDNIEGERVVARSTAISGTDWIIVTEVPAAESTAISRKAMLIAALLVLVLSTVSVFLVDRQMLGLVVRPVRALRDGAERIGAGELTHRMQVSSKDEIGELADAFNDMAGRLSAEQAALRASEERYRLVVENQGEGIGVVDLDERFVLVNPAAEVIFGVATGTLVGRTSLEFVPPEGLAELNRQTAIRAEGTQTTYEMEIVRPDGTRRCLLITGTPQRDDCGRFTGTFGVFRDITERKAAELALQEARDELEQRVLERTADLDRVIATLHVEVQERAQAEEQVRSSLTEKEALLKEIHHRVKNNLQIISSLLSLQAANLHEPQILAIFAESEHRVRSMALIHEKLYRSHDLARINFRDYAEDLLTYLHRSYSDAWGRIQLRVEAEDVMLTVESAVPCGLILNELVNNCFKHAFPGGREGTIVVGIHTNGDGRVHLSVADDGVGLPAGLNLAETTSLGMQLVHSLTEQLGGELSVANGQGASFAVAFAAVEAVEGMPAQ